MELPIFRSHSRSLVLRADFIGQTIMQEKLSKWNLQNNYQCVNFAQMSARAHIKQRPGPKPEFPGLTEAAAKLGVSRYFLWKVLKGYATSAPLLARYNQLKTK